MLSSTEPKSIPSTHLDIHTDSTALSREERIRPIGERLLVRRIALPERSSGGLYILGREYPSLAEVLAIGPGRYNSRAGGRVPIPGVEIGDWVWHQTLKVVDTRVVGEGLLLLDWGDCMAVVKRAGTREQRIVPCPGFVIVKSD